MRSAISLQKPAEPHITGEVFVNELLGGDMIVDVQLDDARIRVKTTPEFAGKPGDPCYMTVNRDKWHVFAKRYGTGLFLNRRRS